MGAAAHAEYAFQELRDGDTIDLGRVQLKALETPGHTVESISLVIYDLDRDPLQPYAVSTHHAIEIAGAISDRDVKRAEQLVARNAQFLKLEWEKLHAGR